LWPNFLQFCQDVIERPRMAGKVGQITKDLEIYRTQLALLEAGPIIEKLEQIQMELDPPGSSGSSSMPPPATRPPPHRFRQPPPGSSSVRDIREWTTPDDAVLARDTEGPAVVELPFGMRMFDTTNLEGRS
jgi:hypothetical protein